MNNWSALAYKLRSYTPLVQGPAAHRSQSTLKRCAVMVPLVNFSSHESNEESVRLLIVRRCLHLRRNPGDYAFPGGMFEDIDGLDAQACALREWHEEMGEVEPTAILGQLDDFHTLSGLSITPIVAGFSETPTLSLSHQEIKEAFYIPLHCFYRSNLRKEVVERQDYHFKSDVYDWKNQKIWGITAGIIRNLIEVTID